MESCLQTCADVLAHFTQLSRAVAQTSSETVFLALCYTHSAPSAAAAVPHKQLIILPITLVIGSSHSVLPQHLQLQWRGGESSFSLKRCNQTYNSQLTAAFFFSFLHPHTHLTCMNEEQRSVSVRQRRGEICLHISSVRVFVPQLETYEKRKCGKSFTSREAASFVVFFYKFSASEEVAVVKKRWSNEQF